MEVERPFCDTCKQNKLECGGYSSETGAAAGHKRAGSNGSATKPVVNGTDDRPRKKQQQVKQEQQDLDVGLQNNYVSEYNGCPPPSLPGPPKANPMDPPPPPQFNWMNSTSSGALSPTNGGMSDAVGAADGSISIHPQDDERGRRESLFSGESGSRNRMPYFRWLGPTAIMPGFKQMVVKVKRQDQGSSTDGGAAAAASMVSPPSLNGGLSSADQRTMSSIYDPTPGAAGVMESDVRTPLNLPFYDTSPMPPSELITHLANTFFTHLGCNYPFLQRERFLRDLEEKQVDAILVDAVCALAARFSTHALLTQQTNDENKITPAEYGHVFAQRAKTAMVDTFPCPSVAAVQAALLLAYNEFGESRDSGLWMYLGISIRMAQDLGMHKLEGLKYKGMSGPTPKTIKRESMSGSPEIPAKLVGGDAKARKEIETAREKTIRDAAEGMVDAKDQADDDKEVDEQKAVEQERVDTFWSVFFLDRVVSSGTGRRSTLRDKDIELSLPSLDEMDPKSGWPSAFPALIRIVHLYGRVADLLNSIKEPSDITTETPKRLASMESQVTNFYQGLSARLHFDAVNFQHYMKAGEGTNFVLLHFWFHTLIVLLHQPTLLKTFEGRMLQLFPNSQQLSMSSAKTIADILSYSHLMDAKASLGNPFTTQPIYIAACAFLKETVEQTATSNAQSRASSPTRKEKASTAGNSRPTSSRVASPESRKRVSISELSNQSNAAHQSSSPSGEDKLRKTSTITELQKSSEKSDSSSALSAARTASALAKHTLLATAASQHYQLCYKALQSLETYWAGTKYILTVLDQKYAGVGDPLLYTVEEGESSMERPRPEPAFNTPGWRRKLSWGPYLYNPNVVGMQGQDFWMERAGQMPGSPGDLSKAIGWTLTGTMNSPNTSLAWHYPNTSAPTTSGARNSNAQLQHPPTTASGMPGYSMISPADYDAQNMQFSQHMRTTSSTSQARPTLTSFPTNDGSVVSNHDSGDMLMGLDTPYQRSNHTGAGATDHAPDPFAHLHPTASNDTMTSTPHHDFTPTGGAPSHGLASGAPDIGGFNAWNYPNLWNPNNNLQTFGDMMIESQDVDTSMLGLDMMPWFDSYLPQHDLAGFFDPNQNGSHDAAHGSHNTAPPGGGHNGTPQG